jgi:HlyD family secretion protein
MKRAIIVVVILLILGTGGFFIYRQFQSAQQAVNNSLQTVEITRGDLTATVGATGTVRANQTATVVWQTTGSIEEILVQLDQEVDRGQVLAVLAQNSLPQNVILAQAELVEAQRALDLLKDSQTSRAQAELALVEAQKAFEDAERKRGNLNYPRGSAAAIDAAEAAYILAQDKVDQMQAVYNEMSGLSEDDARRALALSNLSTAKKERDRALANLNWYKGSSTPKEIDEAQARLDLAQAQLTDAQREWDRLKDGPDPDDLRAAEARIAAIQATLDMARITSPITGTVTEIAARIGDQAAPAAIAFRIDDLSHLLVDVPISEVDINRIHMDQEVILSFDAILGREYRGHVIQVGRVGLTTQGVVNFTVTVEITDADEQVRPGMTAGINIVSTQLENVLLVPNRAVRSKDGKRVVYIQEQGLPRAVEIDLGASSDTVSEVLSGELAEGDAVILNPPVDLQGGNGFFMGGG